MAIRILSSENITGNLTLSGNQTTGGNAYVTGTSNSLVVISRDNMYVDVGQLYIGADDSTTDDTFRQRVTSGSYFIESRKSGTWTNRLQINTAGTLIVQQGMAISGNIDGVGATFTGTAASGAALVTIENNSGSTATSYGLLVLGGGNSSNGRTFEVRDASGNTDLIVKGDGNVGINTNSPLAKLSVVGSGENGGIFFGNSGAQEHRFYASANSQFNTIGSSSAIWNWAQYTGVGVTPNYKMTLNSTGLGIGTTTPIGKLTVQGDDADIFLRSNDYTIARIINRGSTGTNLDTGIFSLYNTSAENVRLDGGGTSWLNGGNVGIGTTSPNAKLDVEDTVTYQIMAKYNATNYTEYGYFGLNVVGGGNPYLFKLQGTERIRITSVGNIQFAQDAYINTNTADASDNLSLQLSGGGAFGDTRGACIALAGNENGNGGLMQLRAGDGSVGGIRYYTGGSERMRLAGRLISFNSTTGVQEIRGDAASAKFAIGNMGDASSQMMVSSRGFLTLNTSNTGSALDATERMRINSSGNVGINYHATGGVVDPVNTKFIVGTQPPYNMANSKIPTTTATFVSGKMTNNAYNSILQLVSVRTSLTSGQFSNGYLGFSTLDNSNAQGVIDAGRIAIVNEVGGARNSPTALSFWTNTPNGNVDDTPATEKMRITSGGNVGIGYTSPVYKLQLISTKTVATNIGMYSSAQGASTSNYSFYADANGATNNWAFYAASGNSYFASGIRLGGNGSSNELDDYEEGTWTPAVSGSTTAGTATYGSQGGSYTKIGNKVTCWFSITNFTQSGASGNFIISGLPFTCITTSSVRGCFSSNLRFYNMPFPGDVPVISLDDNNASFAILWSRNNTTWIGQSVTNSGNQYIEGYVTYSTA